MLLLGSGGKGGKKGIQQLAACTPSAIGPVSSSDNVNVRAMATFRGYAMTAPK